jgi:hypothetical protein
MEMVNIKTMLGLIPAPKSGSLMEKNKKIGSQMGQTDKKTFNSHQLRLKSREKVFATSKYDTLKIIWKLIQLFKNITQLYSNVVFLLLLICNWNTEIY